MTSPIPGPPVAPVRPRVTVLHGAERVDEYAWLRDRDDPATLAYLEAENAYAEAATAHLRALEGRLHAEMVARVASQQSLPVRRGPWLYYSRAEPGQQYSVFARRRGSMDAPEEVVLDPNELARGQRYYRVGTMDVSPDHRHVAFIEDTDGSERLTLRVREIATGRILPDRVEDVFYWMAWATDGHTLLYTRTDAARRPDRVYRHTLGAGADGDVLVHQEDDERFPVNVARTRDDAFLLITAFSVTTTEILYAPADDPTAPFRAMEPRREGIRYEAQHRGGEFWIRTDDGAPDFRIVAAPDGDPRRERWREVVPGREGVMIEGFDLFRRHLVLWERRDGLRRIRVRTLEGGEERELPLPGPAATLTPGDNPEFDAEVLRFGSTSLVTPPAEHEADLATGDITLTHPTEIEGYDSSRYGTTRLWATAEDGARIPITLAWREPLAMDGTRPLVLRAYGAYGMASDPAFSPAVSAVLDHGAVYAIAHVRGGGELGTAWYEQGRGMMKHNSFGDFVAAARELARQGWADPARMAAEGRSAGGMLVAAVLNQHPGLFRAAAADVPFVDMIDTLLDPSLPLTPLEWEQWGNPADPEDYHYLRTYSPYDNVARQPYPALLVTAGINDRRVGYWEPAKWVARLRALKTDDNLLLLRTDLGAGHGGASGRYAPLRQDAFRYAFLLSELGVDR